MARPGVGDSGGMMCRADEGRRGERHVTETGEDDTGQSTALGLRWGRLRFDLEAGVYGTVVLMTVLVVALDDGIDDFPEATQIILGPLLATFAAHLFAAVLARSSRRSAPPPSRAEIRHMVGHAAQYLLLAVVPLIIVLIGAATGLYTAEDAVDDVIWAGLAFLVVLGGVGGYRARGSRWAAFVGAVVAGVLGLVVLVLRIAMEH